MRSLKKKLTVLLAATCLACSAASLASCSNASFVPPQSADISGEVSSNGGFVVEKGNFVYFINGVESSSADNTYGDVVKGSLYRIDKASLASGAYNRAERVVPSLFVSQNYDGGVYIYGDYVYYASPTTEKEKDGTVSTSWLSFKRAKLDGTSSKKDADDYLFRLDDNTITYRFVEENGTVYCMYVKSGNLYSFNVSTGATTLLVSGAAEYYFDTEDLSNGEVYYLMDVPTGNIAASSTFSGYNQIYRVSASATATVDANATSYTVDGYKTYSFDRASIVKQNEKFDASDISQYPYVNLGRLVLDGRGGVKPQDVATQFNDEKTANNGNAGYKYALVAHRDGRIIFSRTDSQSTSSDVPVYSFLAENINEAWNSVSANADKLFKIAENGEYATASAVYYQTGDNLGYLYVSSDVLYRSVVRADGSFVEEATRLSSATASNLWKVDGNYLYYYGAGSSGNNLYRINYTGEQKYYLINSMVSEPVYDEYAEAKILDVQWNDSWYMPEFADNVLLYANAQSFGSTAFNYIYAVDLNGENGVKNGAELKALNDKYEAVIEHIEGMSDIGDDGADLVSALQYYFRTGKTEAYDAFLAEAKKQGYKDHYRYGEFAQSEFAAFTSHTANGENDYATMFKDGETYYDVESYFINQIGETKASDAEAIENVWKTDFIAPLPEQEDDGSWSTTKNVLVSLAVAAGVLAVAAAIIVPVTVSRKKKAKAAADREATAIRRPKIDTTDDTSIDVYATETTENVENAESVENAEPISAAENSPVEASENADNAEQNAQNGEENAAENAQSDAPSDTPSLSPEA